MQSMYREQILDHYKNPRNFGKLFHATTSSSADNPLCGDSLTLHLKLSSCEQVENVSFEGTGCAISIAAASMLTEFLKGKTRAELLAADKKTIYDLLGVEVNPGRERCATLILNALAHSLKKL